MGKVRSMGGNRKQDTEGGATVGHWHWSGGGVNSGIMTTLGAVYHYHPYLMGKELKPWGRRNSATVTQVVNAAARIPIQEASAVQPW